jgi:hypothetical protein
MNLSLRMHMRRFTRLTKVENHAHSVALFTTYYNFVKGAFEAAHVARDGRSRCRPALGYCRYREAG